MRSLVGIFVSEHSPTEGLLASPPMRVDPNVSRWSRVHTYQTPKWRDVFAIGVAPNSHNTYKIYMLCWRRYGLDVLVVNYDPAKPDCFNMKTLNEFHTTYSLKSATKPVSVALWSSLNPR